MIDFKTADDKTLAVAAAEAMGWPKVNIEQGMFGPAFTPPFPAYHVSIWDGCAIVKAPADTCTWSPCTDANDAIQLAEHVCAGKHHWGAGNTDDRQYEATIATVVDKTELDDDGTPFSVTEDEFIKVKAPSFARALTIASLLASAALTDGGTQ